MRTERFSFTTELPVSTGDAFAWHERAGAFARLAPPWMPMTVLRRHGTIQEGDWIEFRIGRRPLAVRWLAEHGEMKAGRFFTDVQARGPFRYWRHVHRFEPRGETAVLSDDVDFIPPLGGLGRVLLTRSIQSRLSAQFAYRRHVLVHDLSLHDRFRDQPRLTVGITGASGLVGTALRHMLTTGGHRVVRLVRRDARSEDEIGWEPAKGIPNPEDLARLDALVHLAGENVASGRWTSARKERIRVSRVEGTRRLAESIGKCSSPPAVFVTASAIGYYGDRSDALLTESDDPGQGFLADVARGWEAAAAPATEHGVRHAAMRFGVILSPKGGALPKMLTPTRFGAGAIFGDGQAFMSWITLDDAVAAIVAALFDSRLSGPVNVTAPEPVRSGDFARTLGRVVSRPVFMRVPAFALRTLLGEMADEMLLASLRVEPTRLQATGFEFRDPELAPALATMLGRNAEA